MSEKVTGRKLLRFGISVPSMSGGSGQTRSFGDVGFDGLNASSCQPQVRFLGKADMNWQVGLAGSLENGPKRSKLGSL